MHFFKIDKELAKILPMEVDTFFPKLDSAVVAYMCPFWGSGGALMVGNGRYANPR